MQTLTRQLRQKALVWAEQQGVASLIVAGDKLTQTASAGGVCLSHRKYRGKRIATKGPRRDDRVSIIAAKWPTDGLVEVKMPRLVCVLEGRTAFQVGERVIHCGAGNFILIPPGTPHPDGSCSHADTDTAHGQAHDNGCSLLWLERWGRSIQCKLCHSRGLEHIADPEEHYYVTNERALQLFDFLSEELLNPDTNSELSDRLLPLFLTVVERDIAAGRCLGPGVASRYKEMTIGEYGPIEQAREYVRGNLRESLSLDSVAKRVHLSRTLFTRQFRAETGCSFGEFVTTQRLEEAKRLLSSSEFTIGHIAKWCGFSTHTYFHRIFQQHESLSPGEFRRRAREPKSPRGQ